MTETTKSDSTANTVHTVVERAAGLSDDVLKSVEAGQRSSGRKFDAEALMATRAFDTDRLVHATAIGTIYGGLMLPFVYQVAEGLLPGRSPRKVILKTMM